MVHTPTRTHTYTHTSLSRTLIFNKLFFKKEPSWVRLVAKACAPKCREMYLSLTFAYSVGKHAPEEYKVIKIVGHDSNLLPGPFVLLWGQE